MTSSNPSHARDTIPRTVALTLVLIVLCGTAAPLVFSQGVVGQSGTDAQPTASNNTTASNTTTTPSGGGGSGIWGGGGNDSDSGGWQLPSLTPPSVTNEALNMTLGPVLNFMVGTPQFDIGLGDGSPGWHAPDSFPYEQMWPMYVAVIAAFTLPLTTVLMFLNAARFSVPTPKNTFKAAMLFLRAFGAFCASVLFHLPLVALAHLVVHSMTMAVAPDPASVTSDAGSMFKFTVGVTFFGASMAELGWDFVKWIGIINSAEWVFLLVYPLASSVPVAVRFYAPRSRFASVASSLQWIWGGILIANFLSSCMLWAFWNLEWAANFDGVLTAFMSVGFLFMFVIIDPLVIIAVVFTGNRATRLAMSYAGGALAGGAIATGMKDRARARAGDVRDRAKGRAAEGASAARDKTKKKTLRGAVKTKNRYHDAKSRVSSLRQSGGGDSNSASTGSRGYSTSVSTAERIRNLEQRAERTGGASATQRRRYMDMQFEERQVYDSGIGGEGDD